MLLLLINYYFLSNLNSDLTNYIKIFQLLFLIFLSIYDIIYYEINDALAVAFIALFGILNFLSLYLPFSLGIFFSGQNVLGAIIYSLFFSILIILTKGKVGGGEIRVGAIIGLICGIYGGYLAILIGFILGATFGIFLSAFKSIREKSNFRNNLKTRLPLIPFLSAGVLIYFLYGEKIRILVFP